MRAHSLLFPLLCALLLPALAEDGARTTRIAAVDPAAGAIGDVLTARGENLGPNDVAAVFLTDGKTDCRAPVVEQTATRLRFRIPPEAKAGNFTLMILAKSGGAKRMQDAAKVTVAEAHFDEWIAGAPQAQMRWSAHISPAILSSQQRLLVRMEIQIDGAELEPRRTHGRMILFAQLNDEQGAAYMDRGVIDLDRISEAFHNTSSAPRGLSASNVTYDWFAFVVPGDYRASFAILDTATGEHDVRKAGLRVAPLRKDPLPDAWRDLPRVEFRPIAEPPELWYLPTLNGRLRLPVESSRPVHVDLVVNLTPSEQLSGAQRIRRQNLNALLPAIKAISQLDLRNGSLDITLLDLSRRRVIFQQEAVRDLDWERLKDSLAGADVWTVDVKSLQNRKRNAAFFVSEIGRRIAAGRQAQPGAAAPRRVLIVLSGPVAFESGEDLSPVRITAGPDSRVFYVRLHAERPRPDASPFADDPRRRGGMGGFGRGSKMQDEAAAEFDQLASTLKTLGPRLFDVSTPQEFRGALAAILKEMRSDTRAR